MILRVLFITVLCGILGLLQSTVFFQISPFSVVPDITLIVLIFSSWHYGSFIGQISGFLTGLIFDILTQAPLGSHALIFTILGYVFGRFRGIFFLSELVLFPLVAVFLATLFKQGGAYLFSLLWGVEVHTTRFFTLALGIEIAMNLFLAPLVFLGARRVVKIFDGQRGGFH